MFQQLHLKLSLVKKATTCACVANAYPLVNDAKSTLRRIFIATHDYNHTRAHVLFLADHLPYALFAIVGKGLRWMF